MNYYGSYTKLRDNSISAMIAAIEIYNKPSIEYKEESVVILAINSWELLFKAILSKHKIRIFKNKIKGKPYHTLNWYETCDKVRSLIPDSLSKHVVFENLTNINSYRNNVVHYYSSNEIRLVIYGLLQSCVLNYNDYLKHFFKIDLSTRINWMLLPIGLKLPNNPIEFLEDTKVSKPSEAKKYLDCVLNSLNKYKDDSSSLRRIYSVLSIKLVSISKHQSPDLVVGIDSKQTNNTKAVETFVDPNNRHPYRRKDILQKLHKIGGVKINTYTFDAICWMYRIKENNRMCWRDDNGTLTKYSTDVLGVFRKLTKEDIFAARQAYSEHQKQTKDKHRKK